MGRRLRLMYARDLCVALKNRVTCWPVEDAVVMTVTIVSNRL